MSSTNLLSSPEASIDAQILDYKNEQSNSAHKLTRLDLLNFLDLVAYHGRQYCAGWAPGIIALFLGFGVTFWTSRIIASFHEHGGKRNIRYRDLASSVLGNNKN